jgi:hypothetical protein
MILPQIAPRSAGAHRSWRAIRGNRSVHEFFAKIARLAFSKGAAFCYAVTVGVSGQAAYNYLKPHDPAPMPVSAPAPYPAPSSGAAILAPIPGANLPETTPSTGHPAWPASLASVPAAPSKPAAAPSAATAPILPEPASLSLPSPAALPAPALKPAALPPSQPATATAVEPPGRPIEPVEKPAASVTASPVPLPDMPAPSVSSHHRAAEAAQPTGSPDATVAAPVPLLPSTGAAEVEKAAVPVRPGPGSGGLY